MLKIPEFLKQRALTVGTLSVLAVAGPLVGHFEGDRLKAYLDPPGIATICKGHTAGVKMGDVATPAQCEEWFREDLSAAIGQVDSVVPHETPLNARAAFASFVYNAGFGKFKSSTLLRLLRAGDLRGACDQLPRWVYAGGVRLPGLVRRRAAERELCLSGI